MIIEIDNIIDRINLEEEHRPLRILGIKATYAFLKSIYATIITIVGFVAEK